MKGIKVPVSLILAVSFILLIALPVLAFAKYQKPVQEVDMLLTKIMERLTLKTEWGDVYFNKRDVKKIIHGAAHLRPIDLGNFTTDKGVKVHLKAAKISKSVVTFHIWQ